MTQITKSELSLMYSGQHICMPRLSFTYTIVFSLQSPLDGKLLHQLRQTLSSPLNSNRGHLCFPPNLF